LQKKKQKRRRRGGVGVLGKARTSPSGGISRNKGKSNGPKKKRGNTALWARTRPYTGNKVEGDGGVFSGAAKKKPRRIKKRGKKSE